MQKRLLLFLAFWCWVTFASHAQKSQPPKTVPKPLMGAEANHEKKWLKEARLALRKTKDSFPTIMANSKKVKYLLNKNRTVVITALLGTGELYYDNMLIFTGKEMPKTTRIPITNPVQAKTCTA